MFIHINIHTDRYIDTDIVHPKKEIHFVICGTYMDWKTLHEM